MGERLKEIPEYVTKYTEFPKHKPVYDNILADADGNIWVVLNGEKKDEKGIVFDAFDPEGEFISRVQIEGDILLPSNRNAYIVHNRSLLLLKTGMDDLYHLIRYKISG
jgi:sugar lactone lactonase YvrE